jgi:hypothetical protein
MPDSGIIAALVSDSREGHALLRSPTLEKLVLSAADEREALGQILARSDYTSYHLLFALRRHSPDVYQGLPAKTKARILVDALEHLPYLNDWGILDPSSSHDGEAATALLELRAAAIEPLRPVLDNAQPAPLFGSEPATVSQHFQYRRCDFAYRYLSLLLGLDPSFDPEPRKRDEEIARLKVRLEGIAR